MYRSTAKTVLRSFLGVCLLIGGSVWIRGATEEAMFQVDPLGFFANLVTSVSIDGWIGTAFALVMAFISAHFYNHRGRAYAKGKAEKIASPGSFRFVYRYIQLTTIVAAVGTYLTHARLFLLIHQNLFLMYLGLAIAALAMALFVTAKLNLGEHYSPCFDSFVPRDFIQEGLYKYVRHPIYMANILLLTGMLISTGSLWIGLNLVLLSVYYIRAAQEEESALEKRFPDYRRYKARTHMLIPSLKLFFRPKYRKQVSH